MLFQVHFEFVLALEDLNKRGEDHAFKEIVAGDERLARMSLCHFHEPFAVPRVFFFERPGRTGPPVCRTVDALTVSAITIMITAPRLENSGFSNDLLERAIWTWTRALDIDIK